MEDYIIAFVSILMPFLLAIYGNSMKKKCEDVLVETDPDMEYLFLNKIISKSYSK